MKREDVQKFHYYMQLQTEHCSFILIDYGMKVKFTPKNIIINLLDFELFFLRVIILTLKTFI